MLDLEIRRTMRAAVITAPRTCEVVTVKTPSPASGQVLIRVEGCGVCGSNLPKWEGRPWFSYPGEPGNPMGRVKIFFSEPDYYIHGTHEVDSLGEAESHGCIRMRNSDVISLAKTVMAAGGKPVKQSFVRRVINRVRSTHEVRLSRPVRLTVKA